ncbi:MAG: tyrosine-type recombinase/integrase [Acidimicrobiales bacterium]
MAMAPSRFGSVRRRQGGGWQARIQRAGTEVSRTFATCREAELWIRDEVADRQMAGHRGSTDETTLTFGAWADEWLGALAHLRPSSMARAQSALRSQLLPVFGSRPISSITAAEVRRWLAELIAGGLAPSTAVRTLRVLGVCLQVAAEDGHIAANPARGIRPPKVEQKEQRYLSPAEVARLAGVIDPRYRGLVYLGAYGGLRIGEMVALRVRDVNPLHGQVNVTRAVVEVAGRQVEGQPKTRAGMRSVPLPSFVVEELRAHLEGKGPDDLVFPAPRGGYLRRTIWAARIWRPAVERAGLAPLRIHDLRHTAVALWVAAGAPALELAKRAGHSSTTFVMDRYGHLYDEGRKATTDRLDEMARSAVATETEAV